MFKYIYYNPGKTNNKFITSQSFLSSDITPTSSKGKESDEFIVYGSVTRYGPQTSCRRERLKATAKMS